MTAQAYETLEALPLSAGLRNRPARSHGAVETGRLRIGIVGVAFAAIFAVVSARLVDVMVLTHSTEGLETDRPIGQAAVARGDIVDRNGVILATSLPTVSVFADPGLVIDPYEAAIKLAATLPGLDFNALLEQLSSERRFVWIKRGISPREQYEINRLGLPGIAFQNEERRYYPAGALTAHVLGYTDVDGRGIAGIEQALDQALSTDGQPVRLSIDLRVQELLHHELMAGVEEFQAVGASGMIMDVRSGEILAMVSLPDFDPYRPASAAEDARFNRNTLGVYEMGSTFKTFNTAMVLDYGTASLTDVFDATRPIRIGRFTINDFHPERRALSVPEVFIHSSNIASAHMAETAGVERQQEFMGRLGFLSAPSIELPEVASPLSPSPWRTVNLLTVAFGHGIAVSPLQTVTAFAAMVNGGELHDPTLIAREPDAESGTRVVSEATSDMMRRLLRLNVLDGSGTKAAVAGYVVGGKTGTAEKTSGRSYQANARLSSFIAAFPMHDPQYVVFAMLDEPKPTAQTYGYATGGWTAAPVVGRVIEQMGPMVGIAPVDEASPEVVDALALDVRGSTGPEARAWQISLATKR